MQEQHVPPKEVAAKFNNRKEEKNTLPELAWL